MVRKSELLRAAQAEVDKNLVEYLDAWEETMRTFILDQHSGELEDLSEGEGDGTGAE